MDSERIIPGSIIVLIVMIPIVLLKIKASLKKRKVKDLLFKLAQDHNTSIINYEHWNNSAIGLSRNGTEIFLVSNDKKEEKKQVIVLSYFNKCNLVNDNAGSVFNEGNFKVTNAIDLELNGKGNSPERINFYHVQRDGDLLTDELELAEKWCRLINDCIERTSWLNSDSKA